MGSVLGVADVANDIYNMAKSDDIGWNDVANLGLDVAGLLPGYGILAKGAKLAKKAKATKTAKKLDKAAEALRFASSKGQKEIKEGVQKAKNWNRRTSEELSRASTELTHPSLFRGHDRTLDRAAESTRFTRGVLDAVDDALSPLATRYNNLSLSTKIV